MMKIGIGISFGTDAYTVGVNASQDALSSLGSDTCTFGLVFASSEYEQTSVLEGVRSVCEHTPLLGASSAGEITHEGVAKKASVVVVFFYHPDVSYRSIMKISDPSFPYQLGKGAGDELLRGLESFPDLCFMFPDVLTGGEPHKVIKGLREKLRGVPVVGGAAADALSFRQTFQYKDRSVESESVSVAALSGPVNVGVGSSNGLFPIGAPRLVTQARGALLRELDGESAVTLYEEYFGRAEITPFYKEPFGRLAVSYPIGYRASEDDDRLIVRNPVRLKGDGALICSDSVPEKSWVQLMIGNKDEAIEGVRGAVSEAREMLGKEIKPAGVLVFSCASRKRIFGTDLGEEVGAVQEVIGTDVPLAGFYSFGSIASYAGKLGDPETDFENGSITICLIA